MNQYSVKNNSHNITQLFEIASSFAGDLIPSHLDAPEQVRLFKEIENLWGDSSTKNFISHIHDHGNPSNRYDYFGIHLEASDLYKLDQVVFALRNITINLDEIADSSVPTKTYADLIREYPDRSLRHFENLDKATDSVYLSACENNFPFAPKTFKHKELQLNIHMTVSSLEILFKNDIANSVALRNWVRNNIKLSKNDSDKFG